MPAPALDPHNIQLLNWNIAKGRRRGWETDLSTLCLNKDLVLIQEACFEHGMHQVLGERSCWAFAEGYCRRNTTTGVLTIARARTLSHSKYAHPEPLTGFPKASLITEYQLLGHASNLLVANIHAINFTAGTQHFSNQLKSLYDRLYTHRGPIIFSGDFNTWRGKRLRILNALITGLQLKPVVFAEDRRKQAFGLALDHMFVRGLNHRTASVDHVSSSDHNPMSAILHL